MKRFMVAFFILCVFVLNGIPDVFSKELRVSDEDRKELLKEVDDGLTELKKETGKIDLFVVRPEVELKLANFFRNHEIDEEEGLESKKRLDLMVGKNSIPDDEKIPLVKNTVGDFLNYLNSRELKKAKEGEVCNQMRCIEKTSCAEAPILYLTEKMKNCSLPEKECNSDNDCCSKQCMMDQVKKKKLCSNVKVCYTPQKIGASCDMNPLCEKGDCRPVNLNTNQMGECQVESGRCTQDDDCCSQKCGKGGTCVNVSTCQICIKNGNKPKRGEECCDGLYKNTEGRCVQDFPPFEVPLSFLNKALKFVNEINVFPTVQAQIIGVDNQRSETKNIVKRLENNDKAKVESIYQRQYDFTKEVSDEMRAKVNDWNKKKIVKSGFSEESLTSLFSKKGLLGSNVNFCYFDLWSDFLKSSSQSKALNNIMLLMGFETVAMGGTPKDFWGKIFYDGRQRTIKEFSQAVAEKLKAVRTKFKETIGDKELNLTCKCMDLKNFFKLTRADQSWFKEKCPTLYAEKYKELEGATEEEKLQFDDAAGIKGEQILIEWLQALREINQEGMLKTITDLGLTNGDTGSFETIDFSDIDWTDIQIKNEPLFTFTIVEPDNNYFIKGEEVFVAAMLIVGVIVIILGGLGYNFGAFSLAFVSTGLATAYIIGTLRGVWYSKGPEIRDEAVAERQWYKCLSKSTSCSDVRRMIYYPYSNVCNIPANSNACIKNLYYFSENEINFVGQNVGFKIDIGGLPLDLDGKVFLVDPWFPTEPEEVLGATGTYPSAVREGFDRALNKMKSMVPTSQYTEFAYQQTTVEGSMFGSFQTQTQELAGYVLNPYLREPFIDRYVATFFTPAHNLNMDFTRSLYAVHNNIMDYLGSEDFIFNKNIISYFERTKIDSKIYGGENDASRDTHFCDNKIKDFMNKINKKESSDATVDLGSGTIDDLLAMGREPYVDRDGNKIKMDADTYACVMITFGLYPVAALNEFSNYILNWHVLYPHTNMDAAAYPIPALVTYLEVVRNSINNMVIGLDIDLGAIENQLKDRLTIQAQRLGTVYNAGSSFSTGLQKDYQNIYDRVSGVADSLGLDLPKINTGNAIVSAGSGGTSALGSSNVANLKPSDSASGTGGGISGLASGASRAAAKFKDNLRSIQLQNSNDYRSAMKGKEARVERLRAAQANLVGKMTNPFSKSSGGSQSGSAPVFNIQNLDSGNTGTKNSNSSNSNFLKNQNDERAVYGKTGSSYGDSGRGDNRRNANSRRGDDLAERVGQNSDGSDQEIHQHEYEKTIFDYISERYNRAVKYLGF